MQTLQRFSYVFIIGCWIGEAATGTQSEICQEGELAKSSELLQRVPPILQSALLEFKQPPKELRPQEGGPPDFIEVAVALKGFYGADLHNEQWEADIIIMLSWYDPRVAGLVPKDETVRTLSEEQAGDMMWTPDIVVTNTELHGDRVVATSFQEDFNGKEFPYDSQALHVLLASASYMIDDVQLVPMAFVNISDPGERAFDKSDWTFLSHEMTIFNESTGSMHKSRAQFVVHVLRDASPYVQSTIFPEIMIVVLSYTVFLFPVNPGFAMPRVSSAVIAFLSILTISTRTSAMLPEVRRGLVWMELFEVVCKMLLFTVILLNILIEMVFHTWQQPELAKQLVHELRLGFPLIAGLSMAVCWLATGKRLELFCNSVRFSLLLVTILFIMTVLRRSRIYAQMQK
ncbi:unnamed protein product [Durusdinium trenchii]|uniref:Neurotransmitter-gated ion-channel ligand-binding domain-containing protein n=2 Tax=Durusdinium trenchii TaxID=1381693 RepID=A0ABP0QNL1_9DINO